MTTTYADAPDWEGIRELLNVRPPATLAPEAAAQWMRRRDYWLGELYPEVRFDEPAIENDNEWIRTGC
jgi:hypothetical protein